MTNTTTTTPATGEVGGAGKASRKSKGGNGDRSLANAGWFTRISLAIICVLWLVPLVGLFITSFRGEQEANSSGWWTVITDPGNFGFVGFDNYGEALETAELGAAFINSVAIALPATFVPLLVSAFAAYAFTFMHFPGRDGLFLLVVALLVIPNYVAFVPILDLYGSVGLSGTFPAVWLAHIGFGMSLAIYILRTYMSTLPLSVIESGTIDGASHFQIFWRLVLPMSMPALASFAIFQFLWVWNDLLIALVYLGTESAVAVLPARLRELVGTKGESWHLLTAAAFVTMIVPFVVFLLLQRYFVRGLIAGSVKG